MIFLATDFGMNGPYVGQVKAVLTRAAPGIPLIDLFADLPAFEPKLASYLLAAYASALEPGDVMLAVVDPGVGGDRLPLIVEADERFYVGPDNGLFEMVIRQATSVRCSVITWQPNRLSASFHGRDLFGPVAACLARGEPVPSQPIEIERAADWPDDLPAIVYIDRYGNAMTGLRTSCLTHATVLQVGGQRLERARTFTDLARGELFWYPNANGLAEIAKNGGAAVNALDLRPGHPVIVQPLS